MKLWIIEARTPDGNLDFADPQPTSVFGMAAITGITEDQMAQIIYRRMPEPFYLSGTNIPNWPTYLDSRWAARRKTW